MHTAVGVVAQHRVDELGNHLLEFCHKLLRAVGVVLDLAQLAKTILGVADPFSLGVIDPSMLAPTSVARFF